MCGCLSAVRCTRVSKKHLASSCPRYSNLQGGVNIGNNSCFSQYKIIYPRYLHSIHYTKGCESERNFDQKTRYEVDFGKTHICKLGVIQVGDIIVPGSAGRSSYNKAAHGDYLYYYCTWEMCINQIWDQIYGIYAWHQGVESHSRGQDSVHARTRARPTKPLRERVIG